MVSFLRIKRGRSAVRAALLPVLAASLAVGCSPAEDSPTGSSGEQRATSDPSGNPSGVLATVTTGAGENSTSETRIRVDLLSLQRSSSDTVAARFRLTNLSSNGLTLGVNFAIDDTQYALSNIQLVDTANRKKYFVLRGTDGSCLCTTFEQQQSLETDESVTGYLYFPAPPQDVTRATLLFPLIPPFSNVPIGSGEQPLPIPSGQPERRPSETEAQSPRIVPIIGRSAALDGASSVEEGAETTKVRLSADVLFKVNKATLTPKAQEEIRATAKRINESGAQTVHIDGYTDNTGGPEINDPLSRDRARSVERALEPLISRSGMGFEVQGHGSDDPVAPNGTEEGRQKNRRVTVSFNS